MSEINIEGNSLLKGIGHHISKNSHLWAYLLFLKCHNSGLQNIVTEEAAKESIHKNEERGSGSPTADGKFNLK